jgi:hypothetical protein
MREILQVVRDNEFHTCSCGGGKDVAILWVICHCGNQILVALYPCFREIPPYFIFAVYGFWGRETEILLKGAVYLDHDLIGPFRMIETRPSREP